MRETLRALLDIAGQDRVSEIQSGTLPLRIEVSDDIYLKYAASIGAITPPVPPEPPVKTPGNAAPVAPATLRRIEPPAVAGRGRGRK
jgi:hypothetical protein